MNGVGGFFKYYYDQEDLWGELTGPDVIRAEAGSFSLGQKIQLFLKIKNAVVLDAKAKLYGGPYLFLAAGFLCEWVKNQPIERLSEFSAEIIFKKFDFPEVKKSSGFLVEEVIKFSRAFLKE